MKFIIADGDANNFQQLEKLLLSPGLFPDSKVVHCASLEDTLAELLQGDGDFVFFDFAVMGRDPLEGIRLLRNSARDLPLIIMGQSQMETVGIQALRCGADDFIAKTDLTAKVLPRLVRYALERAKIRSQFLDASAIKSAFMANMSHEIRTPLNLIIGTADLLAETNLDPQQRKLVNTFNQAGSHLLTLLTDILDLSQVESKGLTCSENVFNPKEVFLESCDIVSVMCRSKKLKFDYLMGANLPTACIGDKVRVRQVLLNLLNNSIKFTDKGQIQLRMELFRQKQEQVCLRIQVKDTGIGIASDNLQKVFEPFYQGEIGLKRKFRGSGLGLSIVKAIVEHYKGDIEIQSTSNEGTNVTLTLNFPLAEAQPSLPKPILKGERILVVTHGVLEGKTICSQLEAYGARPDWLGSGELAVERLNAGGYSYAIMDVQTTDTGSLILLNEERFRFPKRNVVLLLPPIHRKGDIAESLRLGVQKHLYKPFSELKFMELFERNRSQTELEPPKTERSLRILVVDDDTDNRDLMAAYFAQSRHQICYAENGFVAVELAQKREFDLILMDIEMPGLNGYETTRRIKTLDTAQSCKIVGLSANAFPENILEAKLNGFHGYLTKPIRKDKLLESVMVCLQTESFFEASALREIA